ncbi:hypothetical protein B0H34DRAFT_792030 [Crassisporium funariophilum]|nr:hypothetical protein B0H34DRAFT_792030 [Crassisporium funariophilum]
MVRADGTTEPVSVWKHAPYIPLAAESAKPRPCYATLQSEAKKETTVKKKVAVQRRPMISGVWPCKINGCNKQFAREADLKRHQRTTKLHSMPSFACPQCDATFTRTDAQRRHQKSRHNGIVIEPIESTNEGDENSRSRSGTPSSKGKEKAVNIPVQTHQGMPTVTGPSTYYRQHTATTTPYMPPRIHQVNILTSSARTAPPWPGYPQWPTGAPPPNMGPISYIPHPMYFPSPHYRPHTTGYPSASPPPSSDPGLNLPGMGMRTPSQNTSSSDISRNSPSHLHSSAPPADSLDINHISDLDNTSQLTAEDVVAAVRLVMNMQAESEEAAKKREEEEKVHGGYSRESQDMDEEDLRHSVPRSLDLDDALNGLHGYGSSFERPEPMEHMLTEDGEPMLNPAELLTQESLASPPPS